MVSVVMLVGCDSGGSLLPPNFTYLATYNLNPGKILRVDGATEQVVLTRPAGPLTSFVFDGPTVTPPPSAADWAYFCNAINGVKIYRADDSTVYTHTTYVRDLAVGPDGALYFSEASGAGGDGKIYRFDAAGTPSLFYTVSLAQVGGFFAGNFAFDPLGTLYISNGNIEGASLWQCPIPGAAARVFQRTDDGVIMGFCFPGVNTFLFTDLTPNLRQAFVGGTSFATVFVSPATNQYRDVLVNSHLFP